MNKKIYDIIHYFVDQLHISEVEWRNRNIMQVYFDANKDILSVLGKTKEEQIAALIALATRLITEPETTDNYPTINFVENGKDN